MSGRRKASSVGLTSTDGGALLLLYQRVDEPFAEGLVRSDDAVEFATALLSSAGHEDVAQLVANAVNPPGLYVREEGFTCTECGTEIFGPSQHTYPEPVCLKCKQIERKKERES